MRGVVGSDGYRLRGSAVCAALCLVAAVAACGGEDAAPASAPPAVSSTVAGPPATTVPSTTEPAPLPTSSAPSTTEPAPPPPTTSTLVTTTTTIAEPDGWVAPDEYEEYVTIADDYEALEVEVPVEWADHEGYLPFTRSDGAKTGVGLRASPDVDAFVAGWSVPGMAFSAKHRLGETTDELLALNAERFTFLDACTAGGVEGYDDGLYVGVSQVFSDCGGTLTSVTLISAIDEDSEVTVFLSIQTVTAADEAALQRIIDSFVVVGSTEGAFELVPEEYSGYREVIDKSGVLKVTVPNEWTQVSSGASFSSDEDESYGTGMTVSTDVTEWDESWGVPGVSFDATSNFDGNLEDWFYVDLTNVEEGDWFYRSSCTEEGVYEYEDQLYTGLYGNYVDCGGGETDLVVVVAAPADDAFVILLAVTLVTDADEEALQRILDTFEVTGDPG